MWRQTPEGVAFLKWSENVTFLIPLLHQRDRLWQQAWMRAIGRAKASVPADEQKRFFGHEARLQQRGLRIATRVSLIVTCFFGLIFLMQVATVLSWNDAAATIVSLIIFGLSVALLGGLTIFLKRRRTKRCREAQEDQSVAIEKAARAKHWGFDPLTTNEVWFPWHRSPGINGYADRLEHQLQTGPTQRPQPSQLLPIIVPEPRPASPSRPDEGNQVLESFSRENAALSR